MTTTLSARERRQRDYFECARNRYPTSALLDPPVHTILELRRVIEALADVDRHAPIVDFGAGTGRLTLALARGGFRCWRWT